MVDGIPSWVAVGRCHTLAIWARELPRDMKESPRVRIRHSLPVPFFKDFISVLTISLGYCSED
jgi:hypothetical protein